ncbi:hypothetical protein HYW99_01405 [Candidatus Woesearchaeota archaeon]|nr:hypothetical protein [Candidatus Woesearchaeota archaeon]
MNTKSKKKLEREERVEEFNKYPENFNIRHRRDSRLLWIQRKRKKQ